MARKAKTAKTYSTDRATAYAQRVVDGTILAGPLVRAACKRHLDDLKTQAARGLFFDEDLAQKAIDFFEKVLKLNGGQFEGLPFNLLGWQDFVVGSIFGWVMADTGFRRFRVAYVETAKGSGKSPLAAGIGMKGIVGDQEPRAEIYAAATKKDQAMILFRDAIAMYDHSPLLRKRLVKSGVGERAWNLSYQKQGSFFRPIAKDDSNGADSGPRPHISLIDEIHEHKDNGVIEMLRAGQKSRRQPLLFGITNSGNSKKGPCWAYHELAENISKGEMSDDKFFYYVCSLDEEDDPFKDETCWPKANPSLQEANLPGYDYIRQQVVEARNMPSKEAIVRRLCFCQWTGAESPWLSHEVWKAARREYDIESLRGRRAIAALDLSSTTDLTALVFLVEPVAEGEPWKLVPFAFMPEQQIEERTKTDRAPYDKWVKEGYIIATPGKAVSKRVILQKLSAMCDFFEVVECCYDRWRIEDLKSLANDEGITLPEVMTEFGQGFKDMSPAVEAFEVMLLNATDMKPEQNEDDGKPRIESALVHNGHPVLTMCAGNAVTEQDAAENRKLSKDKATGRIDLIVAGVMCAGRVAAVEGEDNSIPEIIVL